MDGVLVQKFKDAISKSQNIGIVVTHNSSIDQMAAALSLYLLLKSVNKNVSVASSTDPIVEISSLVGIDKVQKTLSGEAGDLVVSFPYTEGEIEKVSYTIENNFLNIIVKASEVGLSFDDKEVRYTRGSGAIDLLFAIGITEMQTIGEVLELEKVRNTKIINIDIQSTNQGFGDIVFVDPLATSVSEQISDLALTLGFHIDADVAQNIMRGLADATNNFQNPQTSSLAFEMAGIMMKQGAKRPSTTLSISQQGIRTEEHIKADLSGFMQTPTHPQQAPERTTQIPTIQPIQQQPQLPEQPLSKIQQSQPQEDTNNKPPLDWLAPKVYKSSSNFEG